MYQLRHIELEGLTNLRNLGGYSTRCGTKTTKWGVLYRSDQPSKVPADVAQSVLVDQLHIHHTFDLRDVTETRTASYAVSHVSRHAFPIDMSKMGELLQPGEDTNDGAVALRLMQNYYRHLVTNEGPVIGQVVKAVLRVYPSRKNACMIHCTAGKDRTGWTTYLLLSLLNITESEKREDYARTESCFKIPKEAYEYEGAEKMSKEAFDAFWGISFDYIDAAMDEVNMLGGMEAYAKSHMGLTDADIQQLREVMLE